MKTENELASSRRELVDERESFAIEQVRENASHKERVMAYDVAKEQFAQEVSQRRAQHDEEKQRIDESWARIEEQTAEFDMNCTKRSCVLDVRQSELERSSEELGRLREAYDAAVRELECKKEEHSAEAELQMLAFDQERVLLLSEKSQFESYVCAEKAKLSALGSTISEEKESHRRVVALVFQFEHQAYR